MKQNHGYELDFSNKRIIVTKSFLKEAGIIGSVAYAELAKVRKDYPDFKIMQRVIKQKQGKKTYGNLTYKAMKEFIEAQESSAGLMCGSRISTAGRFPWLKRNTDSGQNKAVCRLEQEGK